MKKPLAAHSRPRRAYAGAFVALLFASAVPSSADHTADGRERRCNLARHVARYPNGFDLFDANGNKVATIRPAAPPAEEPSPAEAARAAAVADARAVDRDRRVAAMDQAVAEGRRAEADRLWRTLEAGPTSKTVDWSKVSPQYRKPMAMLPEALATARAAGQALTDAEAAALARLAADPKYQLAAAARAAAAAKLRAAVKAAADAEEEIVGLAAATRTRRGNTALRVSEDGMPDAVIAAQRLVSEAQAELASTTSAMAAAKQPALDGDVAVVAARAKSAAAQAEVARLKATIREPEAIKVLKGKGYW